MSAIREKLVLGIRDYFRAAHKKQAVLGLSGGIDSAVVARLLVEALGKENVTALLLPAGTSDPRSLEDAQAYARTLGIQALVQPLKNFAAPFAQLPWKQSPLAEANAKPRLRAVLLYNYANSHDALVVGTGNRTELVLGYFTKHGDGAADLLPIGMLWKRQVRKLASELGIPKTIFEKAPSADLWPGQTDEGELGMTYEEADEILSQLLDQGKKPAEIVKSGQSTTIVEKVLARREANVHKNTLPKALNPFQ